MVDFTLLAQQAVESKDIFGILGSLGLAEMFRRQWQEMEQMFNEALTQILENNLRIST